MPANYLSLTDAAFLYQETTAVPMSIASVQLLELPAGVSEDAFIQGFKQILLEKLPQVPYLTRRLATPLSTLDHPRWETTQDFDITRHVHRVQVPAPGAQADIERTIAELHAAPMDRAHPLWDYAILCGLPNNRIAYYARIHHACADGMAAQVATQKIHSNQRETSFPTGDTSATSQLLASAKKLDPMRVWLDTMERFSTGAIDLALSSAGVASAATKLARRSRETQQGLGALTQTPPPTPFNRPVNTARGFAMGELPLRDIRAMAKATHCTINDVFLSLCSGALQRYLRRLGQLPDAPLIAGCPVSLRRPGEKDMSNRVSMMQVDLATNLDGAQARLAKIAESTRIAKAVTQDLAEAQPNDVVLPGLPMALRVFAEANERLAAPSEATMPINLVISNVPGPRKELYSNGAKVLTHYPVSIAAHGAGLNITVQSYAGVLYFSITCCAKAVPEPQQLRDDLLAAFAELCTALPSSVTNLTQPSVALEHSEKSKALPSLQQPRVA